MSPSVIRVLHIARYRSPSMERKVERLAAQPDLALGAVRPARWRDLYGAAVVQPQIPGVRVWTVPMVGRPDDPHRALYGTLTFAMRAVQPHLIHAEEEPDSLAALQIVLARRLFAPRARLVLHTWQNVDRPKGWHVRQVLRWTLGSADAVLCANREAVSVLRALGYAGRTAVIPPIGVDTRIFRPMAASRSGEAFIVAYAGRFVPEKGLDLLLEAVARLEARAQLWLMGAGPERPRLEALAARLGIADRVRWLPPAAPEALPAFLAQVDVVVLPSRSTPVWKEQFGRILVEAMACRVPVIGAASGAIPEVVGEAGWLFPEGDVAALAEALRRLMADAALRQELAERGYARALALYTQERVAEQTAAFYREILS